MNAYLVVVLGLLVFEWLFSMIVEMLNIQHFSLTIPKEFEGVFDVEKYAKSQSYLRTNTTFKEIKALIMLVVTILFVLLGGFRWMDGIAKTVSDFMILQGLAFAGILFLLSLLVDIPFGIYDTFVIEERFGFNKTTVKTFILDFFKSLLLTALIGAPIFALILWFFGSFSLAWLWVWIALSIIQIFLMYIAPVVIMPLFNKFTPLEDGELKTAIETYAKAQNYGIKGIFTMDGSKRSTKSNAYFTGFGNTKRIAMFDTLIAKHTIPELIAVLAHEVGHCKLGHIIKSIIQSLATSLVMFLLLSVFIHKEGLYQAFQLQGTPLYAGFFIFFFLYTPVSMITGILSNIESRKHEYQADAFAAKTTRNPQDMISALKKLSVDDLSNLTPHPMKVFMDYSHPPVLQRIKALQKGKIGKSRK